jgi:hypothetical protein
MGLKGFVSVVCGVLLGTGIGWLYWPDPEPDRGPVPQLSAVEEDKLARLGELHKEKQKALRPVENARKEAERDGDDDRMDAILGERDRIDREYRLKDEAIRRGD